MFNLHINTVMTDGRLGIAGRSWEQLQPLLFLGNQMDEMRNSQPSCPGKSKCLCLAAVICQGREFVILTDINSEMMNLGLLFFLHKKRGERKREGVRTDFDLFTLYNLWIWALCFP